MNKTILWKLLYVVNDVSKIRFNSWMYGINIYGYQFSSNVSKNQYIHNIILYNIFIKITFYMNLYGGINSQDDSEKDNH